MSAIKWYQDGIYSRTRARRNGEQLEVFYGRVWIRSERKARYFKLGMAAWVENRPAPPRAVEERMRKLLGNPEAAVAERAKKATPPPGPRRMDQLVDEFLQKYHSRGGSLYYKHVAASWKTYFGKVDVAQVTKVRVEDYQDHLRRGAYGDSTVRKYVSALGTLFRWAIGRGYATANPVDGVKRLREPSRNVVYLPEEDAQKVLAEAQGWVRPMIGWALESGMRLGEILSLKWSDVDRKEGLVKLDKTKTGKARAIPINAPLAAILDSLPRAIRVDEAGERRAESHVFLSQEKRPIAGDSGKYELYLAVKGAFQRAKVPLPEREVFNLFRHTYGTRLARLGVPMIKIAQLMGNSPRIVEKHYAAFAPNSELREVMDRLAARVTVAGVVAGVANPVDSEAGNLAEAVENKLVGATGFEPATTCTPSKCATRLRYAPTLWECGILAARGLGCQIAGSRSGGAETGRMGCGALRTRPR